MLISGPLVVSAGGPGDMAARCVNTATIPAAAALKRSICNLSVRSSRLPPPPPLTPLRWIHCWASPLPAL
jgi:hypothetical protein